MIGQQGYKIAEAIRQIYNCFDEWDPVRSETFFEGCLIAEYLKYVNSKGGRIEPDAKIWR